MGSIIALDNTKEIIAVDDFKTLEARLRDQEKRTHYLVALTSGSGAVVGGSSGYSFGGPIGAAIGMAIGFTAPAVTYMVARYGRN